MANILCVMGESGSGKTTSMRNLDPKTTYYIDADKKGLSWKGWKEQYNSKNKNYLKTDEQGLILKAMYWINGKKFDENKKEYVNDDKSTGLNVKTLIIDTINGVMVADEMRRRREKGYDKWDDLAASIWGIIDYALTMRDDLNVIFVAHTQTDHDDNGYMFTRIKTSGKKLDKISVESKFPTVLHARCIEGEFVFETKANFSTAKTPFGAFSESTIPNDIVSVINVLKEF